MNGGKRPGAGRPPGARNKKGVALEQAIARSGMDALEYMATVMEDTSQPAQLRLDAAKAIAPYVHPRLSATEITTPAEEKSPEELAAKLVLLLEKVKDMPGLQNILKTTNAR